MKKIIFFLVILLLLAGCEKLYEKRTYHKVVGVGYVYDSDTKEPAPNVQVFVRSGFISNGWGTTIPIVEYFSADINGYFSVKFLKRTQGNKVTEYKITAGNDNYITSSIVSFSVESLQGLKGAIKVDTVWLEPRLYNK